MTLLERAAYTAKALREYQFPLGLTHPLNDTSPFEHVATLIEELIASVPEWRPTHQHYKGGLYRVITRGRIEADLSPVVIYDNEAGETWVRPVVDFDQTDPFVRFAPLPTLPIRTEEKT